MKASAPSSGTGGGRVRARSARTNSSVVQASITTMTTKAAMNSTRQNGGSPSNGSTTAVTARARPTRCSSQRSSTSCLGQRLEPASTPAALSTAGAV